MDSCIHRETSETRMINSPDAAGHGNRLTVIPHRITKESERPSAFFGHVWTRATKGRWAPFSAVRPLSSENGRTGFRRGAPSRRSAHLTHTCKISTFSNTSGQFSVISFYRRSSRRRLRITFGAGLIRTSTFAPSLDRGASANSNLTPFTRNCEF